MKVKAEQCEGPLCNEIDKAEKGFRLPYGWIQLRFYIEGEGTTVKVFHDVKCMTRWLFEEGWSEDES